MFSIPQLSPASDVMIFHFLFRLFTLHGLIVISLPTSGEDERVQHVYPQQVHGPSGYYSPDEHKVIGDDTRKNLDH